MTELEKMQSRVRTRTTLLDWMQDYFLKTRFPEREFERKETLEELTAMLDEEVFTVDEEAQRKLRDEGRVQGIAEGQAKGEAKILDGMRAIVADRARGRFGDRAAAETEAKLATVTRAAQLMDAYVWVGASDTESALLAKFAAI